MPTLLEKEQKAAPVGPAQRHYTLRAFAYKQDTNLFVAECIDLNLMVKAKSMQQAVDSLYEAVTGYLTVACEGDTKGLIPRRSPVARRFLYHWLRLRIQLAKEQQVSRNAPRLFEIPEYCHA